MAGQLSQYNQLSVYRTLVQHLPDSAFFLLDTNLRVLLAEGTALRGIFQFDAGFFQRPLQDLWPKHLVVTALPFLEKVLQGKNETWTVQIPDRMLSITAVPLDASEAAILIFVRDMTREQQQLERIRSDAERYKALVEDNHELMCRLTRDGIVTFTNSAFCQNFQYEPHELIGTSFFRLCLERDVPMLRQMIRMLTPHKPDAVLELRMRSVGATQRWIQWSFYAITDAGGNISEIQTSGHDITEKVRTRIAEQKQQALTDALRDTASVLNKAVQLNEVLDQIIDIIDLVVQYDTVNIMLIEDHFAAVVRGKGYDNHNIKGVLSLKLRIPRTPHLRDMYESHQELVISNLSLHTSPCLDVPELCWIQSYIGAPIISEDKVIGYLNLESVTPDYFTPEQGRLVMAFADTVATAIRNAQLFEQARQAAVIEEKQRLARELHDAVSQTLFSANMIADALPLMMETQPTLVPNQLRLLRQQTQLAMAELRAMLFELRPQTLADTDIHKLLEQMIQAFTSRTSMEVSLHVTGTAIYELTLDIKIAFYRIAQEAINNAIQHANATEADVSLNVEHDQVSLAVVDNGRGFDHVPKQPGHMGLRIMQERAEAIGANLNIVSKPGLGTSITVNWQAGAKH